MSSASLALRAHVDRTQRSMGLLHDHVDRFVAWGSLAGEALVSGGRMLVAGNGESSAQAQHLTAELVDRFRGDRLPSSAIALHAETSARTANDDGAEEAFARQVRALGRPGDLLLAISTSGCSPDIVHAIEVARSGGMTAWGLTGPGPNPVTERCHDSCALDVADTATIQELHQVAIHLVCIGIDRLLVPLSGIDRASEGLARRLSEPSGATS